MESYKYCLVILLSLAMINCGSSDGGSSPNNDPLAGNAPILSLDPTGDQIAIIGEPMKITLSASDTDGDIVTFSTDGTVGPNANPYGGTINNAEFNLVNGKGEFTWLTDSTNRGLYNVEFTATDDSEDMLNDSMAITIRVTDNGGRLYTEHCQPCHGDDGRGQDIPDELQSKEPGAATFGGNIAQAGITAITVADVILQLEGEPNMMLIAGRTELDPNGTGLEEIVAYINDFILVSR